MKLRYLAIAAACAAISGQASALTVAQSQASSLKLFISGSSALQKVIEGVLSQNCGSDYTKFVSKAGSAAATTDTTNGNSHNIYSCTLTGADFGAASVGKTITLVKREAGGSAYGVFPVAANSNVSFLDISSCNDTDKTCTGLVSVKPDAGVSDLEPVAFNSAVNRPTAFATQAAVASGQFAVSGPVAEQVFGLVVNTTLYTALQADQGLASTVVPSVSSAAFTSLYIAGAGQSGLGWAPLLSSGNVTSQVNICSRALGSGTRASAQIQFLQSPSNIFPLSFASPALDNSSGAVKSANADSAYFVSEETSSGNVVACVNAANANSAYAIGLVSADRDLTGTGASFVKLDNQTANTSTAKNGQYPWVFEAFYNVNKLAPNLALAKAFGTAFALPVNINSVSTAAKNGVMASPENCQGDGSVVEAAVCSRVSRNGDSRQPLVFIR